MTTIIQGIIRCVTPLHSATESVKNADGALITQTATETIFMKSGVRDEVPYYKGTSQRGGLRRAAARRVLNALVMDKKVSRGLMTGMMSGSESGTPDNASLTVEEVMRARSNIFMGIFGGGARILPSHYAPIDMKPVIPSTVDLGLIPQYLLEDDQNWLINARGQDLINTYGFVSVDDIVSVKNINDIENYLENGVEVVAAHQVAMLQNKADRKAAKDDKSNTDKEKPTKLDKKNMLSIQAIAPGVPLYFQLKMDECLSPAQIGLMTQALCDLINEQEFGGWVRVGYGRVTAHLTIEANGEAPAPIFDMDNDKYVPTKAMHDQFIVPMQDELAKLTVEEMLEFYVNRGTKK
jgi:CRISPR type IV-associated protein Csf2